MEGRAVKRFQVCQSEKPAGVCLDSSRFFLMGEGD